MMSDKPVNIIIRLAGSVILSLGSAAASYVYAVNLLKTYSQTYSHDESDIMKAIMLYGDLGDCEYLAPDNIFIYFPSIIFLFGCFLLVCIDMGSNIRDMSSFLCPRVSGLGELKKICTRHKNWYILLYAVLYFVMCMLLGSCAPKVSYFLCMAERMLILIFLKDMSYIINRRKDSVHSLLFGLIVILIIVMLDAFLGGISIISIPVSTASGICTLLAEILACAALQFISVSSLGRSEVL